MVSNLSVGVRRCFFIVWKKTDEKRIILVCKILTFMHDLTPARMPAKIGSRCQSLRAVPPEKATARYAGDRPPHNHNSLSPIELTGLLPNGVRGVTPVFPWLRPRLTQNSKSSRRPHHCTVPRPHVPFAKPEEPHVVLVPLSLCPFVSVR